MYITLLHCQWNAIFCKVGRQKQLKPKKRTTTGAIMKPVFFNETIISSWWLGSWSHLLVVILVLIGVFALPNAHLYQQTVGHFTRACLLYWSVAQATEE
jgi:hypothetical protein